MTKKFIEDQNKLSQPVIENDVSRPKILNKLRALWDYPRTSCPARHGNNYFVFKNTGLQNQNVLFIFKKINENPEVFFDPNQLSESGTIALCGSCFSESGDYFAYGLSKNGSDWVTIKVKNVITGEDLTDTLVNVKFMKVAWTLDDKGFFYTKYPVSDPNLDGSENDVNENQKLFYHNLGDEQSKDVKVLEFLENPTWRLSPEISHCGKYLIVYVMEGCNGMQVYISKIENEDFGKLSFIKIVSDFSSDYEYITNENEVFSFRTNKDAKNYHIINFELSNAAWNILIKEHDKNVLDWCCCVDKDKLVVAYIEDVVSALYIHSLNGGNQLFKIPLPIGTISGFSGDKKFSEFFFHFSSFVIPGTVYRFDFASGQQSPSIFHTTKLSKCNLEEEMNVRQIFYKGRDNENIPMFIIEKKASFGKKLKPCLLYGYGGFNISIQPFFSVSSIAFIDLFDGIVALPNIRGGGEYGEKWHAAGKL